MSYTPRTGSVAHRAIEHLQGLAGAEIALRPLADAIDSDLETVRLSILPALAAGILSKRMRDGLCWIRAGSGEAAQSAGADVEKDDAPIVQRVVSMRPAEPAQNGQPRETIAEVAASAPAADMAQPAAFALPFSPATSEKAAKRAKPTKPNGPRIGVVPRAPRDEEFLVGGAGPGLVTDPRPDPPRPARFGAFSDGEMHIEKQGARIVLERFEFETLLRFLTRMCAEEAA